MLRALWGPVCSTPTRLYCVGVPGELTPAIVVNRTSTADADGAKTAIATMLTRPTAAARI